MVALTDMCDDILFVRFGSIAIHPAKTWRNRWCRIKREIGKMNMRFLFYFELLDFGVFFLSFCCAII